MARIIDVAGYILEVVTQSTTMKMQKLAFYAQAHSFTTRGVKLFDEDFQAWPNGPVCPELFAVHRGMFLIRKGELQTKVNLSALDDTEKQLIRDVCVEYARYTGNQLSKKTHAEAPWKNARGSLRLMEPCNTVITQDVIRDYYAKHPAVPDVEKVRSIEDPIFLPKYDFLPDNKARWLLATAGVS